MGLRKDIREQPVTELELRKVIRVAPTDTLRHAIDLMKKDQLGGVVVVDDDGKVVGQFTDRDLIGLFLDRPDPLDEPIGRHACEVQVRISPTDPIAVIVERMQERRARYGIVMDEASQPVGLTGLKGVVEYIADHFPRQVKVQMMKSKLHMDEREGG